MARTKAYAVIETETHREIADILRDQAGRRLTPEEAAAELNVSVASLRRYLSAAGGRIGRYIYMPD